jgi:tight adherence protein C
VTEKLAIAGGMGGIGANEYILLTTMMGLAFPLIIGCLLVVDQVPLNKVIGVSLLVAVISFSFPFLLLQHKINARRRSMQYELPDALDLITVSVEAGLGFEGALVKLSEKMKGALVDEFVRTLNEMRIGITRRDALLAMGKRCNLADVHSFTMALIQADQLGVSIGNVLRIKSASIREKRRQQAEELAMKAPVKMLFPLIFFIFPTIFVILLGPAMITIFDSFIKR